LQNDDIHTQYHPKSKRHAVTAHFDEYRQYREQATVVPESNTPWSPYFKTVEDFSIAEILRDAALSEDQCDRLLKVIRSCLDGQGKCTFTSYKDVQAAWDRASNVLTNFEQTTVRVPYKKSIRTFDMHYRPLWDWLKDVIDEPSLSSQFEWDAQRIFKYNEENQGFSRVYHEPWSGDDWWNIQTELPDGASPVFLLLYADKTRLSSFGGAKGYPVVARIVNLPSHIRNGNGVGGGRVVGWIPIVSEDPQERGKPGWANFKRVVWHKSFWAIIETIVDASKFGIWHECIMSLIRGFGGKLPCPICLVPSEDLSDLSKVYPLRTSIQSSQLVNQGKSLTRAEHEQILKKQGLRNNVFWNVAYTDVHKALTFDRLHSYHSGLFGKHLWVAFVSHIDKQYGRPGLVQIDKQVDKMPTWRDLNHFHAVTHITFSDGTKYEDISKILIFVAYNVVAKDDTHGYALLQCIRSYVKLDLYLSLDVHTDETLNAGEVELQRFGQLLKNWNFPKVHLHIHAFEGIRHKGVTKNYNTKPNEKMHGPLKKAYARTNFKNVAPQAEYFLLCILKSDHYKFVAIYIREQINMIEEAHKKSEIEDDDSPQSKKTFTAGHVTLGSQQAAISFEALEGSNHPVLFRPAFKDFRIKLYRWLIGDLNARGREIPDNSRLASNMIQEYRFLKVNFESIVNWRESTDYLRCSPSFHNQPRHDFVIVDAIPSPFFAQLIMVFTCTFLESDYAVALIRPLDAEVVPQSIDHDLGLYRLRSRALAQAEFIHVQSIKRGALLVDADTYPEFDFFVVDTIDGDMFLRCEKL
ncbi:hypothetical protein DENSPDRAFT_758082, partial [Dentipellis sp. KUC8613]